MASMTTKGIWVVLAPAVALTAAFVPGRYAVVGLAAAPAAPAAAAGPPPTPKTVADAVGAGRGICVVLDDPRCAFALELARQGELTVYVQLARPEDVPPARKAADEAGLLGRRIFVEADASKPLRIHLADDLADVVVARGGAEAIEGECLRVLRPGGKAFMGAGGKERVKPFPQGVDDWSHHYHGPDNNPQSADRLARAPYLTQFIAEPRYAPCPQAAVSSAGRVFMAFGHVAWHEREEAYLNRLVAANAFNGSILWERELVSGIMVDRSTMIAAPDALYLADDTSCKVLDPATGTVRDEIIPSADLTGGTFWKWMGLSDGILYALVGEAEKPDPVKKWRSRRHGWPWDGISEGYNQPQYPWGFARTLLAIEPRTKKVLWYQQEDPPIDSRSICMAGGRIFLSHFGRYIVCLDAKTGREVWRRTPDKDSSVFETIGPYRPGHGYIGGWKSTVYAKCTDKALYVVGPQVNKLTALSAETGEVLWTHPVMDLHLVIRPEGLFVIGSQAKPQESECRKLDPQTGEVLARYKVFRRACTRSTGSPDGVLFRAAEGSVRLDIATGQPQWISPMRPSCHVGVVVANGHLYWIPWACDCNLQMFGLICLSPAGEFRFGREAAEAERLEAAGGDAGGVAPLAVADGDWPAYRRDNARTARSPVAAPAAVRLLWESKPASPSEPTAPTAAGGLVFVGAADGIVRALDAATGRPRWTAYTGGAIRYPPAIADGRAFVGAADGWAYAFEAATGRALWRFRAAPVERKIAVYGRLSSTWPVASGVLVDGGTAYFAAGMNNFDGTHVYAVDAATGKLKWQNNASGHLDEFSRRGVAVQGDMLLHDGKLYLAGGNVVSPGIFDAASGKCLNEPPRRPGTPSHHGGELRLSEAPDRKGQPGPAQVLVGGQPFYSTSEYPVFDRPSPEPEVVARDGVRLSFAGGAAARGAGARADGGAWRLIAKAADGKELWAENLPAEPVRWGIAIDSAARVIIALRDGRILCFAPAAPPA